MKFEFEGEMIEGKEIGSIGTKGQFLSFLHSNKSEIEEIITDKLEEKEIYQWDELDIDLKVSNKGQEGNKHIVLVGNGFSREESIDGHLVVRIIKGTIFCISEADLVMP